MKPSSLLLLFLVAISSLTAQESFAPKSVDVRDAVEIVPYSLSPSWFGTLSLVIPENKDQTKEVAFTHFIRDASAHSDPDSPRPHKPAIFQGAPLGHGQYGVGDTAIFDSLDVDWARSWKTFGDVLKTLPDVIPVYDEENQTEETGFWYNTFYVSKDSEEMEVIFLSFVGPYDRRNENFRIRDVQVWKGTLKPR